MYYSGEFIMLDHFLTSVLQLIIVVDILGVIAYFVLGALRPKPEKQAASLVAKKSLWEHLPWGRNRARSLVPASDFEFGQLKRVLYSYQEGLV